MTWLTKRDGDTDVLFNDLSEIIDNAKYDLAISINSTLSLLNWHIGDRINRELLRLERAEYGVLGAS